MTYNVFDSSVNSYYQNYMYTVKDWLVFDISDTTTIMLIGSYDQVGNSIKGNTKQVITITNSSSYGGSPTISIENVDRDDVVNYTSNTSYRIVSNLSDVPFQKNSTYETSYKTYTTTYLICVALVFAFLFSFIRGLIICRK